MINPERYIGEVILFGNGKQWPTQLFMEYQNGRLWFVAETEMPHGPRPEPKRKSPKVVSAADRLADLVRTHRHHMETFAARI